MRSLALQKMISSDFETRFYLSNKSSEAIHLVDKLGVGCEMIDCETDFFSRLNREQIVVLDGYGFDFSYQKQVKACGCKLVVIDDEGNAEFAANVIINHSPGATPSDYRTDNATRLLLGCEYVLLRTEFLKLAARIPVRDKNVPFICFGGSDRLNMTLKTLSRLETLADFAGFKIVVGQSYQYFKELEDHVASSPNHIDVLSNLSEQEMVEVMLESSLAVVPCSGVLMEAIALKLPFITGYYVENQMKNAAFFQSKKIGHMIGDFRTEEIQPEHLKFDDETASKINSLIDGKSGERVKEAIHHLATI